MPVDEEGSFQKAMEAAMNDDATRETEADEICAVATCSKSWVLMFETVGCFN